MNSFFAFSGDTRLKMNVIPFALDSQQQLIESCIDEEIVAFYLTQGSFCTSVAVNTSCCSSIFLLDLCTYLAFNVPPLIGGGDYLQGNVFL